MGITASGNSAKRRMSVDEAHDGADPYIGWLFSIFIQAGPRRKQSGAGRAGEARARGVLADFA
jgi:hypothetical protein